MLGDRNSDSNSQSTERLQNITRSALRKDVGSLLEYVLEPDNHPDASSEVEVTLAIRALWKIGHTLSQQEVTHLMDKHPTGSIAVEVASTHARAYRQVLHNILTGQFASEVIEAACYSAGELEDANLAAPLEQVAKFHKDDLVREAAVAALGAIGLPSSKDVVLGALKDKTYIRRRAVVALSAFDGQEVELALHSALSDKDFQVRSIAEDLLRDR